jgi:hypothetical protein
MNTELLQRIPGLNRVIGEDYTTKVLLWRRRGDKFQPELHDAVRYRYEDRPNAHVLDSGEEIPAVPLANIYTMTDGTPFFEAIEVEDGQYAPRDVLINSSDSDENEVSWESIKEQYDLEIEKITEESKSRVENLLENRKPVKTGRKTEKFGVPLKREVNTGDIDDNVIKNKDTRLNFWLDHLKESQQKYGIGGILKEHMNIILIVITALAIGIILYTSPLTSDTFLQLMSDMTSQMETLNSNLETLGQAGGLGE